MIQIEEPFGPTYNIDSAKLRTFRAKARKGLSALSREERHAYADAIERAVLARQRTEAGIGLPAVTPKCHCASGTAHNDGADIHRAIRAQQAAALARCPAQERRARTPAQWQAMYEQAMTAKEKARVAALIAAQRRAA
jgi:hypothetical protein